MKFNRILHPEITRNLRGGAEQRNGYRELLQNTDYDPTKGYRTHTVLTQRDPILSNHLAMCYRFLLDQGECHFANRAFCHELIKIDREIPVEYLPEKWIGYFCFADGAVTDGATEVDGAYVYIGPANETTLTPSSPNYGNKMLWISYICRNGFIGHLLAPLLPDKLSTIINPLPCIDIHHQNGQTSRNVTTMEDRANRNDVYLLCLNLILYLFSQDREVIPVRPYKSLKPQEKKKSEYKNYANVPLKLIAPSYRGQPNFTMDKTWVRTHPRWQRCGKGLSEIKLVWVTGHERVYKDAKVSSSTLHA